MQSNLVSFIQVLRTHDVRVSPAETLDAMGVAATLGYSDRRLLRDGLTQWMNGVVSPRGMPSYREFQRGVADALARVQQQQVQQQQEEPLVIELQEVQQVLQQHLVHYFGM